MNKSPSKLNQRRAYVANYINNHKGKASDAIEELAESLFLSTSTIVKDLNAHQDPDQSPCKDETKHG